MQKKIKKLNAFAEKDCNKCELRAACYLANADWQQAKKDYPCFWATDGLVFDIASRYDKERSESMREAKTVLDLSAEVANEALRIAEEKGLTLAEVFYLPEVLKNKIINEMRAQEIPFKRKPPTEETEGGK